MLVTYVLVGAVVLAALHRSRVRLAAARDRGVAVRGGHRRGRHRDRCGRLAVDRREGARDGLARDGVRGAGRGRPAGDGRAPGRGRRRGRTGLRRSAVVERAGLPRGQSGAIRPASGARADRRPDRRRGTSVDDRVRAIRRAPLSSQGGRRGRVGAAQAGRAAALGPAAAQARHGRHRRVRACRDSAPTAPSSCAGHRSPAGHHRSIGCCRAAGSTTCGSWPRAWRTRFWSTCRWATSRRARGTPGAARRCGRSAAARRPPAAGLPSHAHRGQRGSIWSRPPRGARARHNRSRACLGRFTPARKRASTPPSRCAVRAGTWST